MLKLYENIRRLRNEQGMTQVDLADAAGYTSPSMIAKIEKGVVDLPLTKVETFARIFGVSAGELMGWDYPLEDSAPDNVLPLPNMKTVPLVGTIACGEPILAVENVEGNVSVPENVHADFALRCKGDSMTGARINDGDLVFIRQQPTVDDGQIAAVQIGDDATLKRVYHSGKTLVLQAENPAYKPIIVDGDSTVRVLGLAVAFISPIR